MNSVPRTTILTCTRNEWYNFPGNWGATHCLTLMGWCCVHASFVVGVSSFESPQCMVCLLLLATSVLLYAKWCSKRSTEKMAATCLLFIQIMLIKWANIEMALAMLMAILTMQLKNYCSFSSQGLLYVLLRVGTQLENWVSVGKKITTHTYISLLVVCWMRPPLQWHQCGAHFYATCDCFPDPS